MRKYIKCLTLYAITATLAISYGAVLTVIRSPDILNRQLYHTKIFNRLFGENCCSGWALSHYILNMVAGYIFPDCQLFIIFLGISWEIIECLISRFTTGLHKRFFIPEEPGVRVDYPNWMTGTFKDVIINIAGLYTGVLLRKARDNWKKRKDEEKEEKKTELQVRITYF